MPAARVKWGPMQGYNAMGYVRYRLTEQSKPSKLRTLDHKYSDFNNHMKDHSDLGALIVPYEIIFWSYLKMNPINGLDSKVLSDTAKNIITKIELVQNNKVVDAKEHVKIYGQVRILLLNFVKLQV